MKHMADISAGDLTEDGIALTFTTLNRTTMRYDHDAGRWYEWAGDRWKIDGTNLVLNYIREIARELSEGEDGKARAAIRKSSFAAGAERLARTDRAHAVQQDLWDRDGFLLGCPGVTVDLRKGSIRKPDPADGITKQTAVAPTRAACPTWMQFLHEATGGDDGMVEFLRRWCGYCLTGDTREHALIFLYGPGGNGKSVFLNTITRIVGDYATTAAMDTFVSSKGDKHPTDMAMLRGARLVSASETEEGRGWAEAKIKQLTGGDPISARFMRQDFFTFTPQFKLTIVGNHAPVLANVDDAARRRFNIVPFTIKPVQPDRQLEAKLEKEWPAILQWMIEGCVAWQASGLERPESVVAATAAYFNEQDLTAQWLADACDLRPGDEGTYEASADLFASWTDYAKAAGEDVGTSKGMAARLRRHGMRADNRRVSGKKARVWTGVRIIRTAEGIDHG